MNRQQVLAVATSSDLGSNANVLCEFIGKKKDSTFVDLGVRDGFSSALLSLNFKKNNNKIYGVDVNFNNFRSELVDGQNYLQLEGDSSTIGKYADLEDLQEIDFLFVDSLHVREQVLCELHYWVPRLKEGGTVAFHDSHWPEGKRDQTGGKSWNRVDDAIREFFGLEVLEDYEDDNLEVTCYPPSWGMTFVTLKTKNFESTVKDWNKVFNTRNDLISVFWNKENVGDRTIELEMSYEAD